MQTTEIRNFTEFSYVNLKKDRKDKLNCTFLMSNEKYVDKDDIYENYVCNEFDVNEPLDYRPKPVLNLYRMGVVNIKNINFPSDIKYFDLSGNDISDLTDVTFNDNLEVLDLSYNKLTNLKNVKIPHEIKVLILSVNNIETLQDVEFPENCYTELTDNPILEKIRNYYGQKITFDARHDAKQLQSLESKMI